MNEADPDACWLAALPCEAALVSSRGEVLGANRAWLDSSSGSEGFRPLPGVGDNLFDILIRHGTAGNASAVEGLATIRRVLTGELPEFVVEHLGGSDELRWVRATFRRLSSEAGPRLLVLREDRTANRERDQRLIASEARLRSIIEDMDVMVCRYLPDTTLTFVNNAYCRSFGKPSGELLGRRFLEVVPAPEHDGVLAGLMSLTPQKPSQSYQHQVVYPGGSVGWQSWTDRAFFDPQGRIVEFQSTGHDITGQVLTQQKLRESERRYRELFNRVPVAVMEYDLSEVGVWMQRLRERGVVDFEDAVQREPALLGEASALLRIRAANRAALGLYRVESFEQLQASVYASRLKTGVESMTALLKGLWDGRTVMEIETREYRIQGKSVDLLAHVEVPTRDGRPDLSRVILAVSDVTLRRHRMFAQARAEQAERERRHLARELHDSLGQELTGISMLVEGLRRRLTQRDSPEAGRMGELSQLMRSATGAVRRIINGLTADAVPADQLETALQSLAEKTAQLHGLRVAFHCPRSPSLTDDVAAKHLLLIAQEAVHNAVKHARATHITLTLTEDDTALTLEVADNGRGLPEALRGGVNTRDSEGHGLGIMRYRADRIGASLVVSSPAPETAPPTPPLRLGEAAGTPALGNAASPGTTVRCQLPLHLFHAQANPHDHDD